MSTELNVRAFAVCYLAMAFIRNILLSFCHLLVKFCPISFLYVYATFERGFLRNVRGKIQNCLKFAAYELLEGFCYVCDVLFSLLTPHLREVC